MMIDSEGIVQPGGDAGKRKLAESKRVSDTEKVRVIESTVQGTDGSSQRAEVAVQPRLGQ